MVLLLYIDIYLLVTILALLLTNATEILLLLNISVALVLFHGLRTDTVLQH